MELLIAAAVSLVVQVAKKLMGTNEIGTILFLLVVSFGVSLGVHILKAHGLWETFGQLALSAAGIYGLFIRRFETKED